MHPSIEKEIQESKARSQMTEPLRRFVLGVVDECLQRHYGENYSILCFQGSLAIAAVLEQLRIKSTVKSGHVCVIQAKFVDEQPEPFWAGFMDQDDHAWVLTEFGEIVDLTISHLPHHPLAVNAEFPVPAVWWIDGIRWPNFLTYLPQGNAVPDFSPEELEDKDRFLALVRSTAAVKVEELIGAGYQEPVFSGQKTFQELCEQGYPWAMLASIAGDAPLPPSVQNRMAEFRRTTKS